MAGTDTFPTGEHSEQSSTDQIDLEFLSKQKLSRLNYRQKVVFKSTWEDLLTFIRHKGKNPQKPVGYSNSNVKPIARRIFQVFEFVWSREGVCLHILPKHADEFVEALADDEFVTQHGKPYAEGSKRKLNDALRVYFRFEETDWEPTHEFEDTSTSMGSDPFRLGERESLMQAALEYRSPPSYSNLDPEERERWKSYLAQHLGKPKSDVTPNDWKDLQRSWKIPSMVSTTLDAGWRAAMVGGLKVAYVDLENGQIIIPPEAAVKNDSEWKVDLSSRSIKMLKLWLEQRANKTKYDQSDQIWLNRKGNPYTSKTLNTLLSNLIDEAGIQPGCRKLTWHSIRHSVGRYVYEETEDLGWVAKVLRHETLEAARKYANPSPEATTEVLENIQKGGSL